MCEAEALGPAVDDDEDLYRLITTPNLWLEKEGRPTSAAFGNPKFSVNIASKTTIEETHRQLRDVLNRPDGGIVSLNCGVARKIGFDARQELDENFPDNHAHAHVYNRGSASDRKKRARQLAKLCTTLLAPSFASDTH